MKKIKVILTKNVKELITLKSRKTIIGVLAVVLLVLVFYISDGLRR